MIHVGDNIEYSGGCSVLWKDNISTVEAVPYCGRITSGQHFKRPDPESPGRIGLNSVP